MGEVDALTGTFRLPCPTHGTASVRLSAFREIERLAGAAHPAVYRVAFACPCGDDHVALIGHDTLDWSPLGLDEGTAFVNLMTSRRDDVAVELAAVATTHIDRGEWPWSFFCYPEERARPVFPSSFRALGAGEDRIGLAVECPSCSRTSVNLVTHRHVDVPFYNDRKVDVVEYMFSGDRQKTLEAFRAEVDSGRFDARRRDLAA